METAQHCLGKFSFKIQLGKNEFRKMGLFACLKRKYLPH